MIKIKDSTLAQAAEKGMDEFLQVFIDSYLEAIGGELNEKTMPLLNGNQHTLLAWHFFTSEMRDGGFVQLIQNGYGGYIFGNPFAKAMKQFGAFELSRLIYKAKEIYDPNKKTLERETVRGVVPIVHDDRARAGRDTCRLAINRTCRHRQ